MSKPILVKSEKLREIARFQTEHPSYRSRLWIQDECLGSLFVEPGQVWPSWLDGEEGEVIILFASTYAVFFERRGRAYHLAATAFQNHLRLNCPIHATRQARDVVRLGQREIALLMGAICSLGLAGAALALDGQTSSWVIANRRNFRKWEILLEALLKLRAFLKDRTPCLYRSLRLALLGAVQDQLLEDASTEGAAFACGQLVANHGPGALEKTFEPPGTALVRAVLSRTSGPESDGAGKPMPHVVKDLQALADALLQSMKDAGVPVDGAETLVIQSEVARHGPTVIEAVWALQDAVGRVEALAAPRQEDAHGSGPPRVHSRLVHEAARTFPPLAVR